MPLCLTLFRSFNEPVLRNHAHYCRQFGYEHRWLETAHVAHSALRDSVKYQEILRHLRTLDEGDWLLFLDGDSVVFHAIAVDVLMQGRDLLAVQGLPVGSHPPGAMTNMMVLRNTVANRALLHQLIVDAGNVIALNVPHLDEAARLLPAGMLPCNAVVADCYVNVSWRMPQWQHARIFVVSLAPLLAVGRDGELREDMLHDLRLQDLLVRQVNGALMHGRAVLETPSYPALSDDVATSCNSGAPIAFVTLYTHHINQYARVSEHNVRRYCERHGHAYHVYRAIPAELGPDINGTWVKTWLLRRHLADHQWVIWVDADVIFFNQSGRIEPLLSGRDLLLAKDLAAWPVNAGVMGFRNTPANANLLDGIWQRITDVSDKSSVYSSMGDQFYTNEVLRERGLIGEDCVLDNLSINTPPHLASDATLLVHFVNLGEPYRSVYMADMDARSQGLG